jgi:hypothetical protein
MEADKRLSLKNLNDRSLYESMNPSEEGLNGYPSERVNEAEPRSLRWILSINKACDKFLESRGIKTAEGKRSSDGDGNNGRKRKTPLPASAREKIKAA